MNFLLSSEHFYVTFIHFNDRSTLWTWEDKFLFSRDGEEKCLRMDQNDRQLLFLPAQPRRPLRKQTHGMGWKENFLFLTMPWHIDLETIEIRCFRLEISQKRDSKIYTQFNSLIRPDQPTIRTMNN